MGYGLVEARAAKERAEEIFADLPELSGIGITRVADGFAVKLNLTEFPPIDLPSEVDGVPVMVEVVGEIVAG